MGFFNRVYNWKVRHGRHEHSPESSKTTSTMTILAEQSVFQLSSGQLGARTLAMSADNNTTRRHHLRDTDTVKKAEPETSRQLRNGVENYLGLHVSSKDGALVKHGKQLVGSGRTKATKTPRNKPPCSHLRYLQHGESGLGERFETACRPSTPVARATVGTYKRLPTYSTRIHTTDVQQPEMIAPCHVYGIDYCQESLSDDNMVCRVRGTPVINLVPPPEDYEDVQTGKQWAEMWSRSSPSPHDGYDTSLLYGNRYERRQQQRKPRTAPTVLPSGPSGEGRSTENDVPAQSHPDYCSGGRIDKSLAFEDDPVSVACPTASDYLTRAKEYPPLTYDGEGWGEDIVDSSFNLGTVDEDYLPTIYHVEPIPLMLKYETYFCY